MCIFLQRTHTPSDTAIEHHNLRPRPQRNIIETTNEQIIDDPDYEVVGEFLCDNEGIVLPKISWNICCNFLLQCQNIY
jgi:hypothetical protein